MKKIIVALALLIGGTSVVAPNTVQAKVNVNINIGTQPLWGPTGYDYARFYYLPEINMYYDVVNSLYYYMNGNRWIGSRALPVRYRNYDLYRGYKVVINQNRPWNSNRSHINQYGQYRNNYNQVAIRDARDPRYYANKNHPRHHEYVGGRPNHNGRPPMSQNNNRPNNNHKNNNRPNDNRFNDRNQPGRPEAGQGNYNRNDNRPNRGQENGRPQGHEGRPNGR